MTLRLAEIAFAGGIRDFQEIIAPQIQKLTEHIEAIETHLESGAMAKGVAFVRPQERPVVGNEALARVMEPLKLMSERFDRIEKSLTKPATVKAA